MADNNSPAESGATDASEQAGLFWLCAGAVGLAVLLTLTCIVMTIP